MRQRPSRRSQLRQRPENTLRHRLTWLLDFAVRAKQMAGLRGEELKRLQLEVWRFPMSAMTQDDRQALSGAAIAKLARSLDSGIRGLLRNEPWQLRVAATTFYLDLKNGRPSRRFITSQADGFLLEAQDLIAAGAQWLRECHRRECRRVFVANKRQIFCTPGCAQDERTERFLARHTREEFSEQRHARYVKKVRRTKGPAVAQKVRRRQVSRKCT
jgi:hypothetical protein